MDDEDLGDMRESVITRRRTKSDACNHPGQHLSKSASLSTSVIKDDVSPMSGNLSILDDEILDQRSSNTCVKVSPDPSYPVSEPPSLNDAQPEHVAGSDNVVTPVRGLIMRLSRALITDTTPEK